VASLQIFGPISLADTRNLQVDEPATLQGQQLAQGFGGFINVQPKKKEIATATGIRSSLRAVINCAKQSVDEIVINGIQIAVTQSIDMGDVADALSDLATCGNASNAKKADKAKDLLKSIRNASCAQRRAHQAWRAAGSPKATYAAVHKARAVARNGWSDNYSGVVNRMGPNARGVPVWQEVIQIGRSMNPKFKWRTGVRGDKKSLVKKMIEKLPTEKEKRALQKAFDSGLKDKPMVTLLGRSFASHAEVKMSALRPNKPIGVSKEMCPQCQRWFRRLAKHRGTMQAVADPKNLHVFDSNGRQRKFKNPGCKKR
jgi:hypothetical protein